MAGLLVTQSDQRLANPVRARVAERACKLDGNCRAGDKPEVHEAAALRAFEVDAGNVGPLARP